nr:hypothetical protein [Nocardioides ungokensis]
MAAVADLLQHDVDVVITHGNGPQVGNLLVKNEVAASVVPPVPLDWCGAQTQATLGFVLMNALDAALAERAVDRRTATLVTRALVAADDDHFSHPTKPIGRFLPAEEAQVLVEHGETWEDRGEKGWRRVVASPEPLEIVDAPAVHALVEAGFVVVANGGGGIPVVRSADGTLQGSRPSSTRTSGRPCWRAPSRPTCSSSPPTCPTPCCAGGLPRPSPWGGSAWASCGATPARATSRAAPWARRSTRPAGSWRTAAAVPSSPVWTGSSTPSRATAGPSSYPTKENTACPTPLKYARSRSTRSPTPASSRSSSTTA